MGRKSISILGAGSWGSTLAIMLSQRHAVKVWEFDADQCEKIKKEGENKKFLPGIQFPEAIFISHNIKQVLEDTEITIFAIPSHTIRAMASRTKDLLKDKLIVNASKGLEEKSMKRISQILYEETENKNIFVISGPSHAEEVIRKQPTTVVLSSLQKDREKMKYLQNIFFNEYFRVYTNEDIVGVELGGALKNIIAIAAGLSDGMGFGSNTKAALMTRGMVEMQRLACKLGAQGDTLSGLSGMGDLITTCISPFSRNRHLGEQLGKGFSLKNILKNMIMIAEGVKTTKAAFRLSKKLKVDMPITEQLYKILYKNKSSRVAVSSLMLRTLRSETEGLE
ncbi:MAG: NAD(P)H-dependent glycerol-3-phosphate dehydrogenase [Spirochaetes bacterium]|nr:NAD(P)H-dependent glycerol-3-phosphate dehydrogenase [Spirochaetota bacterium]